MRFGFKRKCTDIQEPTRVFPAQQTTARDCSLSRFSGAVISDVGHVRSNNEDNYLFAGAMNETVSDHSTAVLQCTDICGMWQIAGVFDGMGGGEMGELAASETAKIFIDASKQLGSAASKAEVDQCMRQAFLTANNRIVDLQKKYKIFGTTGTVLCFDSSSFKIYHLGDSRAYLFRDHDLLQLTKDQTLAQMKMEVGLYRADDPSAEADKHKLTEYIGRDWTKENIKPVESHWIPIQSSDRILLCSDGLYDMCANEEIADILQRTNTAEASATAMQKSALSHGGEDNITCLIVDFA